MQIKLPSFLRPAGEVPLVRLGRDCDGGYLVDRRGIEEASFLLSGGVNDDFSFEEDWARLAGKPIIAYDPVVSRLWFLRRSLKDFRNRREHQRKWARHQAFFSEKNLATHVQKYIGPKTERSTHGLADVLEKLQAQTGGNGLVKLDIEGGEFPLLDELVKRGKQLAGLVIEFHDLNNRLSVISQFVRKFPQNIVHVHVNNYSLPTQGQFPGIVELTFSPFALVRDGAVELPHKLDKPNFSDRQDIQIEFDE